MGTPEYATSVLKALNECEQVELVGVFTRPDKPVGRKQILTPPHVKAWVLNSGLNVPIFQPRTLKDESVQAEISGLKPDFIVVAAYGQILPQAVLDIAPCINLHASILPKYRGASPIQAAIMAGESETGVTAMLMDAGLDTGDMLGFVRTGCVDKMAAELFGELASLAGRLAVDTLLSFKSITPIAQDNAAASHCAKIKKELGLVSFSESAKVIWDKFRALTPWPGLFLGSGLKLLELELASSGEGGVASDSDTSEPNAKSTAKPGEIVAAQNDGVIVACGSGELRLKVVQAAGKKPVSAKDYINGKRLGVGNQIY